MPQTLPAVSITVFSFACCHCVSARVCLMGTLFQQCPSEAPHTAFFSVCKATWQREGTVMFPCDMGRGRVGTVLYLPPTSASSHVHSVHLILLSEVIALCQPGGVGQALGSGLSWLGIHMAWPGLGGTPGSKEPAHHVGPPRGPSRVEGNCPSVVQSLRLTPHTHPLLPPSLAPRHLWGHLPLWSQQVLHCLDAVN